jgi:hypothetical protein
MARLIRVAEASELTPGQGKLVQVDSELRVRTYVVMTQGNDICIEVA